MSNFCSTCGTQAAPGQRYCAACGASLDSSTSQETIAAPHGAGQGNPHAATRELAGRSCPYCRFPLKEGGAIATCPSCNAVHHAECYTENGGCAVAGCTAGPGPQAATAPLWAGATQPDPRAPGELARHAAPTAAGGVGIHQPDATPPSPPPPRRRRMTFAIVAVAVVMVLLGGGAAAAIVLSKSGSSSSRAGITPAPKAPRQTPQDQQAAQQQTPQNQQTPVQPSPAPQQPSGTPTPSGAAPSGSTAGDPGAAAVNAVNSHWQDIKTGDYSSAYQYLTPAAVDGSGQDQWVASHNQDGIKDVQYSFNLTWVHGDQARVDINQLQTKAQTDVTASDPDGCTHFTGYYILINQNGNWLINEPHLTQVPSC